jgi:hypothetical protein
VEPTREAIEDLMQRYGYEKKEAEAAYYLREAWDRFTRMYQDEAEEEAAAGTGRFPLIFNQVFLQVNVDAHFRALSGLLATRVLGRDYPEGWGPRSAPEGPRGLARVTSSLWENSSFTGSGSPFMNASSPCWYRSMSSSTWSAADI